MKNKKNTTKALIVATAMTNIAANSLASVLEENKIKSISNNVKESSLDKGLKSYSDKRIEPVENTVPKSKEIIKVNKNIVRGSVLQINLGDNDFVQDLSENPSGYETIKITTTGDKKLVKEDYDNLRLSGIPKIDLSNAWSDTIPQGAFSGASHLTEFKFPQGVTSIENGSSGSTGAFSGCSGLAGELIIPNSVVTIGDFAFNGCSKLTGELIIPDSVTSIGSNAFNGCTGFNGNLVISDNITSIGSYAFYLCSKLTGDLVIPESATIIGSFAFYGCSGFNGRLVISDSMITIGSAAFNGCSNLTGELIIPDSVTGIGNHAFLNAGIQKVIIKIDETHIDTDYRQSVVQKLPKDKTYIEISYNFDTTGTWLEKTDYIKVKPLISTYAGTFDNNEGIGVSLEIIEASGMKEITILRNGLDYNLEKNESGRYIFNEEGEYQVYIETELGTISNISFKNNNPILEPSLEFDNNHVSLIDNGILSNKLIVKEDSFEDFDDASNLKYNFSNSSWVVNSGMLKSKNIDDDSETENEFKVNAEKGDKIQISVKTSSESNYDWGYIYLNGNEVYKKTGETGFEVLELDLLEGENTIKFKYSKDSSGSEGSDAMFIDYIKIIRNEIAPVNCDILEYRINGGEWQVYTDSLELNYPVATKLQIEVRAKHDGFTSNIYSQEVVVGGSVEDIEEAVDKLEVSKDLENMANLRRLINAMPESEIKNQLQARLNDIIPNIALDSKTASASADVYIKMSNTLSLSLNTTSITFEDFTGTEDMIKENAINLTVESSLPYEVSASLEDEIRSIGGPETVDKSVLGIKSHTESIYNTFNTIGDPIIILDNEEPGEVNTHSIDLKLNKNIISKADVYKSSIRFEVRQK